MQTPTEATLVGQDRGIARPRSSLAALNRARLGGQLLTDPTATTPEEVVGALLAVQAQDPRGARLAVRARSVGLTAADVDAALTDRRSLVIGWLNRGTLHLVRSEDYWWLHALTAPKARTTSRTRLRQEGVDDDMAERGKAIVAEALEREGPLLRAQLRDRLDDAGVRTEGQALVHVLFAASIDGHLVRGPMVDGEQAFVHAPTWLGPPPDEPREVALARLAARYLLGHRPSDDRELAYWAGLPLGDARTGLAAIEGQLEAWGDDGRVRLAGATDPGASPAPRLLGAFDPILHGWPDRAWCSAADPGIATSNGIFRATALVDGHVAALWTLTPKGVELKPLGPIAAKARAALERDAAAVQAFLGGL